MLVFGVERRIHPRIDLAIHGVHREVEDLPVGNVFHHEVGGVCKRRAVRKIAVPLVARIADAAVDADIREDIEPTGVYAPF
jgi:hypothetical protein